MYGQFPRKRKRQHRRLLRAGPQKPFCPIHTGKPSMAKPNASYIKSQLPAITGNGHLFEREKTKFLAAIRSHGHYIAANIAIGNIKEPKIMSSDIYNKTFNQDNNWTIIIEHFPSYAVILLQTFFYVLSDSISLCDLETTGSGDSKSPTSTSSHMQEFEKEIRKIKNEKFNTSETEPLTEEKSLDTHDLNIIRAAATKAKAYKAFDISPSPMVTDFIRILLSNENLMPLKLDIPAFFKLIMSNAPEHGLAMKIASEIYSKNCPCNELEAVIRAKRFAVQLTNYLTPKQIQAYITANAKLASFIYSAVPNSRRHILGEFADKLSQDGLAIWTEMNHVYYAGTQGSDHQINLTLLSTMQNNLSLTQYYEKLQSIKACASAREIKLSETLLVSTYLKGLQEIYSTKRADIDIEITNGAKYTLESIHKVFKTWAMAKGIELSTSQQRLLGAGAGMQPTIATMGGRFRGGQGRSRRHLQRGNSRYGSRQGPGNSMAGTNMRGRGRKRRGGSGQGRNRGRGRYRKPANGRRKNNGERSESAPNRSQRKHSRNAPVRRPNANICYRCGGAGHWAWQCSENRKDLEGMLITISQSVLLISLACLDPFRIKNFEDSPWVVKSAVASVSAHPVTPRAFDIILNTFCLNVRNFILKKLEECRSGNRSPHFLIHKTITGMRLVIEWLFLCRAKNGHFSKANMFHYIALSDPKAKFDPESEELLVSDREFGDYNVLLNHHDKPMEYILRNVAFGLLSLRFGKWVASQVVAGAVRMRRGIFRIEGYHLRHLTRQSESGFSAGCFFIHPTREKDLEEIAASVSGSDQAPVGSVPAESEPALVTDADNGESGANPLPDPIGDDSGTPATIGEMPVSDLPSEPVVTGGVEGDKAETANDLSGIGGAEGNSQANGEPLGERELQPVERVDSSDTAVPGDRESPAQDFPELYGVPESVPGESLRPGSSAQVNAKHVIQKSCLCCRHRSDLRRVHHWRDGSGCRIEKASISLLIIVSKVLNFKVLCFGLGSTIVIGSVGGFSASTNTQTMESSLVAYDYSPGENIPWDAYIPKQSNFIINIADDILLYLILVYIYLILNRVCGAIPYRKRRAQRVKAPLYPWTDSDDRSYTKFGQNISFKSDNLKIYSRDSQAKARLIDSYHKFPTFLSANSEHKCPDMLGTSNTEHGISRIAMMRDAADRKQKEFSLLIPENLIRANAWIVDSGCTRHTIRDISMLDNVESESREVLLAGGDSSLKSIARGNYGRLTDVQCVPKCVANIFSVKCATRNGYLFTFSATGVTAKADNLPTLTGKCAGPFWYFDDSQINPIRQNSTNRIMIKDTKSRNMCMQWHRRLGHIDISRMNAYKLSGMLPGVMYPQSHFLPIEHCHACRMGKACKIKKYYKPFFELAVNQKKGRSKQAKKRERRMRFRFRKYGFLELVCLDIAIVSTTSAQNHKCFINIICAGTNMLWTYPLVSRLHAFETFKTWFAYVSNKYGGRLKVLSLIKRVNRQKSIQIDSIRSDNEFATKAFSRLCVEHGISQQFTVPYHSYQNAVAERSIRTISEMTRCAIIASGCNINLWHYGIQWAAYTANRLPCKSNPLEQSPYEMVFGERPLLTHLRPFGVECTYALKVGTEVAKGDRFSARGAPAIFIGYSDKYAEGAYLCLNIETGSIIMRRDVRFNEKSLDRPIKYTEITMEPGGEPTTKISFLPVAPPKPLNKAQKIKKLKQIESDRQN